MRITSKGQITIPVVIREQLGLHPRTEICFRTRGDVLVIEKVPATKPDRDLVERMRGRGTVQMSTDEIMRLTRGVGW